VFGPEERRSQLAALVEQLADIALVSEIVDDFARDARAGSRTRSARPPRWSAPRELAGLAREIERLAAAEDEKGARAPMSGLALAVEETLAAVLAERDALVRAQRT
jgi:hypothetical protein